MHRLAALAIALSSWILGSEARAGSLEIRTPDGHRIGTLAGMQPPASWHAVDPANHPGRYATGLWGGGHHGGLIVELGERTADAPEAPAGSLVVAQLELETEGGAPFAEVYCPELELLPSAPNGPRHVRAHLGNGIVLDGFTRDELPAATWGSCPTRVSFDGQRRSHWVTAEGDAASRVQLRGPVYWSQGQRCARWDFRRTPSGIRLERRARVAYPRGGLREEVTFRSFEGPTDALVMSSESSETRWIREPRPDGTTSQAGTASLFALPVFFVRASRDRITWIVREHPHPVGASQDPTGEIHVVMSQPTGAMAYDPADAQNWFRTGPACEAQRRRGVFR